MKRLLTLLGILAFGINPCLAATCAYSGCVEPYGLSNGASRFISVATGSNFLGKQVAKAILKKEITKNVDGSLKIKVDSYSVKDLKKGIFKSISISGKDVDIDGVNFTSLDMNTVCDFNYILMDDSPVFKEDLPMAFSVVMSENDINSTMNANDYKKIIDDLNTLGANFGIFKITSSQVKIRNNRFYYVLKVSIPFVRSSQNLVMTSDLKVAKGQIDFENTKLINDTMSLDLKKIDKLINYINPLDFSLNILENKDAKLTVSEVKIQDNKIYADGLVVIPKD